MFSSMGYGESRTGHFSLYFSLMDSSQSTRPRTLNKQLVRRYLLLMQSTP